MKKLVMGGLAALLCAAVASAATISVDVTTDKVLYLAGETVNWTVYAWASAGDNFGVALLSVDLQDDQGETLSAGQTVGGGPTFELQDTEYGVDEWFTLQSAGTPGPGGTLVDVLANQSPNFPLYNIGNDGSQHLYAKGSYVATVKGWHVLSVSVRAANYWPDDTGSSAVGFGSGDMVGGGTDFEVVPEPATLMLLAGGIGILVRRRRS